MKSSSDNQTGNKALSSLTDKKDYRYMILLIVLVLAYGLYMILRFPFFHTDDFLIFSYIEAHAGSPLCGDPKMDFYLFFRPLSYLYFWVNYQLFSVHAVWMKLSGFFIFLVMIYYVYKTLVLVNNEFHPGAKSMLPVLGTLFFVFHPDMVHCIIWISNANELLMVFFYVLALYVFLKYKLQTPSSILVTSLFFLLSLLAKQQSLHFMLLAGIILYVFRFMDVKHQKSLAVRTIFAGLAVIVAYIVFNRFFVVSDTDFSAYAWKKPFSLVGTLLYVLFPPIAGPVYSFFISHKELAIIIAVFAMITGGVLFLKSGRKKIILQGVLIFIVIFFPRVLAHGGDRVNSIQVLWFSILLFYIVARYSPARKIILVIFLMWGCINVYTSIQISEKYRAANELQVKTDRDVISLLQGDTSEYLIVIAGNTYLLDYTTHFVQTGTFGKNGYQTAPFLVNNMLESSAAKSGMPDVVCSSNGRVITISLLNEHGYLSIDKQNLLYEKFTLIETADNKVGRGYAKIRCSVSPGLQGFKKLYFDGQQWRRL